MVVRLYAALYKIWEKNDKFIIDLSYCYFLSGNGILALKVGKTSPGSLNIVSQLDIIAYSNTIFANMDNDI